MTTTQTPPSENANVTRLLFVCIGNICRSPAAEGIMRHVVRQAGAQERYAIDSAGIGNWHAGQLPDHRMRLCGERHGYCFDSRARQVRREDFDRFDLILAMDADNIADLHSLAPSPEAARKVRPMASFLRQHPGQPDIPDPYYGSPLDFDFAVELLEDACQGLLEALEQGML